MAEERALVRLRAATPDDAAAVAAIYAPYVTDTPVSFETEPPSPAAMAARIEAGAGLHPFFVATDDDGAVLGYASASPFRPRPAYRYAVETSVYVAMNAQRRGAGRALYAALIDTLEAQGFVQAIAAITLPNAASVALHENFGFVPAGVYRQVGFKLGGWYDVGLWQRALAPARTPPAEPKRLAELSGVVRG